ncbi:potassium channel family protein [Cardiobacteriaceae bacterium TAE3-ERU3]|nr:potassium channel family protein [Cardiobacteriaceae bacterium TAE3-ERU3]
MSPKKVLTDHHISSLQQNLKVETLTERFVNYCAPPQGKERSKLARGVITMFVSLPFLFYIFALFDMPYMSHIMAVYSALILYIYVRLITEFKRYMNYHDNLFNFVKIELIIFINLIIYFGFVYYFLGVTDSSSFNEPLELFDAMYFSLITISTVGYGHYYPMSMLAKLLVMSEILIGMWMVMTVLPVVINEQSNRQDNSNNAN